MPCTTDLNREHTPVVPEPFAMIFVIRLQVMRVCFVGSSYWAAPSPVCRGSQTTGAVSQAGDGGRSTAAPATKDEVHQALAERLSACDKVSDVVIVADKKKGTEVYSATTCILPDLISPAWFVRKDHKFARRV